MKNKIILLSIGVLSLTSCSEDFLDKHPSRELAYSDIQLAAETRPELLDGTVKGLYSTMYTAGSGGTNLRHDDFGQKGWDIYSDMLSSDMALLGVNYGWYSNIADLTVGQDYTQTSNYMPWRYNYRVIYGANGVLSSIEVGDDGLAVNEEARAILGQALAMRAYSYYNLMNLYVDEYIESNDAIPMYTVQTTEPLPKSTCGEVYGLIIDDLEKAVINLEGFSRGGKFAVNQDVARGMLAYAYAAVGRNAEAAEQSLAVINNGAFSIMTASEVVFDNATQSGGGFNNLNTAGWMWGVDLTLDIGLDLVSWWGQVDIYTYSYAWAGDVKGIDQSLYNSIPDDDVRKGQFVNFGPSNKFFAPNRVIGGQREVETDYVYMRIAEMYLLYAETAAKSGNELDARVKLKTLLDLRIPDSSYVDALSGQDLLDEIYKQMRIELWGEGKIYYAMKRNRKTVTRGGNHLFFAGDSFPYNDSRLTLEIPQTEIQNNPFID